MAEGIFSRSEAVLVGELQTFANVIAQDPQACGLTESDSDLISGQVAAFVAARAVTLNPDTRTPTAIILKNQCRNSCVELCRLYAIQIKYNAGISDALKAALGIDPPNPDRTPVYCPQSAPTLIAIAATNGAQTMRYIDPLTPGVRKKPYGAIALELYRAVGTTPVDDPAQMQFYKLCTANPVPIMYDYADNGKIASYAGRWVGRRGDTSPFSPAVSLAIAA